jgi:hypothetical protein
MATVEYESIKLLEQHSAWDPVKDSKMEASHIFTALANGKPVRRITREGGVVTVEHIQSGRKVELPWSNVRHAVVKLEPAQPTGRGR